MTNVEIIKEKLLPLLKVNEDNPYKKVFYNAWKSDFIKTIHTLDKKCHIDREDLDNVNLEEALNRYSKVINEWNAGKNLDVFWITGFKIYKINQYPVLREFYKQGEDNLFKALIHLKNKNKNKNIKILLELALNNDLSEKNYKIVEKKTILFLRGGDPEIKDLKKLVKIGTIYNSNLIWKYYIEVFKNNQNFINNVKEYFDEENIKYDFEDNPVNLLLRDKYSKVLQLNPNFLYKNNAKISLNVVNDIMIAMRDLYHNIAKEIEKNVEMELIQQQTGDSIMMVHFDNVDGLNKYVERINQLHKNLKEIIAVVKISKNKKADDYKEEINKIYSYYKLNDFFEERHKSKIKKI